MQICSSQFSNRSCKLILECLIRSDAFLDHPTTYISIQTLSTSRLLAKHCQYISKSHSNKNLTRCWLKAGILKPVYQATPWINSFVLVEGKNKLHKLKLRICLDSTNLNKVIILESHHFQTPEDIAHLLADTSVHRVGDCRKGFWHQQLDEASSVLTTFNNELGRSHYTVLPFSAAVDGDFFNARLILMNDLARLNKSS